MARHIAKNIVAAAGGPLRGPTRLRIGVAEPVQRSGRHIGTCKVDPDTIPDLVRANFHLTPKGIIDSLKPAPPDLTVRRQRMDTLA